MTIMLTNKSRRLGVAAMAVAAAAAVAVGGASAANAASGTSNQGVSNAVITPDAPAVNFDTPGTWGRLTFNMSDGKPDSVANWTAEVGDESAYQFTLPEGMRFLGSNPVCPTDLYPYATTTCTLSENQREWIVKSVITAPVTDFDGAFADFVAPEWLVVSTGPIVGAGYAIYTPWYTPGANPPEQISSDSRNVPITVAEVPPNDTPLLAGGVLAALGLGGAGAVYGWRRHKKAA